MASRKLGKGLNSLLANRHASEAAEAGTPLWVAIDSLEPNREQPREAFEVGALQSLAESIRSRGILQPILVSPLEDGRFEILAGERRWRAAQEAGQKQVPVIVREAIHDDSERLELALIENVQRSDLDAIERAKACRRLMDNYGLTQEAVSQRLGQDRSTIGNLVRLLELPPEIQRAVSRETISPGHARALLRLNDHPAQKLVLESITKEGLSVRATEEACAAALKGRKTPAHKPRPRQPAWMGELQDRVHRETGLRTEIRMRQKGGGRVVFHFDDLDQLDQLTHKLGLESELDELLS